MADVKQSDDNQAQAAQDAAVAQWEGDFKEEDLIVPYKKTDEKENDDETEEDKSADDKPDDKEDTEASEVETIDELEPDLAMEDPGEYQPADYSFEVTLSDGRVVKVTTPEEADKLADDPDNFETPRQLSDFLKKSVSMSGKLERDYERWEAKNKTFTEQVESESQRREQINGYVNEFSYLVSKGLLPEIPKEYQSADWTDPEVAKQPAVKAQQDVLNYMLKENKVRAKVGIKPLTSVVDAFNAYQQDSESKQAREAAQKAEADAKAAADARRAAGSRVAGVSPAAQTPYVPKGIAVGNPNVLKRGAGVWDD